MASAPTARPMQRRRPARDGAARRRRAPPARRRRRRAPGPPSKRAVEIPPCAAVPLTKSRRRRRSWGAHGRSRCTGPRRPSPASAAFDVTLAARGEAEPDHVDRPGPRISPRMHRYGSRAAPAGRDRMRRESQPQVAKKQPWSSGDGAVGRPEAGTERPSVACQALRRRASPKPGIAADGD